MCIFSISRLTSLLEGTTNAPLQFTLNILLRLYLFFIFFIHYYSYFLFCPRSVLLGFYFHYFSFALPSAAFLYYERHTKKSTAVYKETLQFHYQNTAKSDKFIEKRNIPKLSVLMTKLTKQTSLIILILKKDNRQEERTQSRIRWMAKE